MSRRQASRSLRSLSRNSDGLAMVEFGFVAPLFLLILMGVFDQGFAIYIQSVLNGAVQDGARRASLENTQWSEIEAAVNNQIRNVVPSGDPNTEITFTLDRSVNVNYNEIRMGEFFTDVERAPFTQNGTYDGDEPFTDSNGNRQWDPGEPFTDRNRGVLNERYDAGECFIDLNNNNVHDDDIGVGGVKGNGQDVVSITASLTYRRIFPFWKMMGQPQNMTLTASTFLRNQPFSAQLGRAGVPAGC